MRATESTLDPGLHLKFGALRDVDAAQAFASEHGLLGPPVTAYAKMAGHTVKCEALWVWWLEVRKMAHAISLWNAIRSNTFSAAPVKPPNPNQLKREAADFERKVIAPLVKRLATRAAVTRSTGRRNGLTPVELIKLSYANIGFQGPILTHSETLSPRDVAFFVLTNTISRYNQELAKPIHQWIPSAGQVRLELSPKTLLGAMWAQFADGVRGGAEWRECQHQHCRRLFEVSLKAHRQSKKYCSPKCNLQDWRARDKAAKRARSQSATRRTASRSPRPVQPPDASHEE